MALQGVFLQVTPAAVQLAAKMLPATPPVSVMPFAMV